MHPHPPTPTDWYAPVRAMTERLMVLSTISPNVDDENRCADLIVELLTEPDGDGWTPALQPLRWHTPDGRQNIACLLRGAGGAGKTLILMAHYDVVGVDEFKALDPTGTGAIAFTPERLREVLLTTVSAAANPDAYRDLHETWRHDAVEEPAWLFGRGSVDMKSGLAINIALLRTFARVPEALAGNLLLLASPDEENESAGILSALSRLIALRDEQGLDYVGVINTDYTAPRTEDMTARYIYSGVVGKLLPSFYVLGDPTHVGEPFRGIDANQIAAELVRRLNLNPRLSDSYPADAEQPQEVAVPPVTLKLRDLKPSYNVQTSAEAFAYINWLTYTYSPQQAIDLLETEATEALKSVFADRDARFRDFRGSVPNPKQYVPLVLKFSDLCQRVRQKRGWFGADGMTAFNDWLDALVHSIAGDAAIPSSTHKGDAREISQQIVARMAAEAELVGPAVVIFFSPPYYPHSQPTDGALTNAIATLLTDDDLNPDGAIQLRAFYPYIADISFLALDASVQAHLPALIDNLPLYGRGYALDFDSMRALNCPVVNIGPWGKDAHGLYERVHMPYSFCAVPQFIYQTILRVFDAQSPGTYNLVSHHVGAQYIAPLRTPAIVPDAATVDLIRPRVVSEHGVLQAALVHRPGAEIDLLDPLNKERLLFEDIPFLRKMQLEHDAFCTLMREQGIEVIYLDALLRDLLMNEEARGQIVRQVCAAVGQPGLARLLLDHVGSDDLLRLLFAGLRAGELQARGVAALAGQGSDHVLLEPIPNAYFTRDPAAVVGDGFVACKAHFDTRVRETVLLRLVAELHPRFAGTDILFGAREDEDRPFTIEGGDIHVLSGQTVLIGSSQRTRSETVGLLARKLFQGGKVQRVYEVEIPSDRRYMHLDTVFTIIARGVIVVYPDVIDRIDTIRRYEPALTSDGELIAQSFRETRKFHTLLADEFGTPLTVVNTGGNDARYASREQGADGTNVFAIAPGRVISYDRNLHTNAAMRSLGIEVLEIEGSELVRGLGGPRCMALPLKRA
ncbi:MAG: arginine deiminase family protein [Chloroflexota bacterium]|nr:arginine deiminase family protein [Chloroflexota bacterium]